MNTLILDESSPSTVSDAASLLRSGLLVALPTETVYGLAADASNIDAIRMIFHVKNRPVGHPLIMHFADIEDISNWVTHIPDAFLKLAHHFWPGPLSVLLNKRDDVFDEITGGSKKVCVRIPNHPLTLSIIRALGNPIVAPSANAFGGVSPTCLDHVKSEMYGKIAAIVDGGVCDVGLESTILDLTEDPPILLRPGGYSINILQERLGLEILLTKSAEIKVSGNLLNHYQPKTKLLKMSAKALSEYHSKDGFAENTMLIHHSNLDHLVAKKYLMPCNPILYGKKLYAVLRELDGVGFDTIYIEDPPEGVEWMAVEDRLLKASHKST
jgi:L-threonylcarbamoyladenylate synthase